ncbi:PAS domain S-box protein [Motilimonas pumila]|uniref:histidine kinase n=1 Tax=Motilimonas pumila TaxID=2303987 RepID=A0A418YD45_9GAMM|nr:PAS domain S-box protein [Motilimonas pumila]RJG42457.1 PAS domain S-box protein [Motilimonas pumila]
MSFRLKTIIAITLLQSALLLVLIISVVNFLKQTNEEQLKLHAQNTSALFATSVTDAVLATDLASLQSFIDEVTTNQDVMYARILNNNDVVLAEGGKPGMLALDHSPDHSLAETQDGVFDTHVDITASGVTFGRIEVGISTHPLQQQLGRAHRWIMLIASIEVALVLVFSFLLGSYLTRQLRNLKQASENIALAGPGHQIEVVGNDEIAEVGHALNAMSTTLATSYQQLSESIDKQRELTEIASQNQAKNNAILTASLDAMITIDDLGHVLDYNKMAEQVFGWRYEEIHQKNLADFIISPQKRDAHHQGMQQFLLTKSSPVLNQRLELNAMHKQGHSVPIEINIAPIETEQGMFFTAFIRDISDRLAAETELRLAAQTFESSEAIFICDTNSVIMRTNNAFTRITGYRNDEVVGKTPKVLASGQHDQAYYEQMWNSLIVNGEWSGEIYNKRKNGEIYPEYLNISSVKSENGEISHYIAHFMDITEQKTNEEKLRSARYEAEMSNESKSRFLATMSHEIRTPMNAVLGILGLLKDTDLTPRQLELVQMGRESGELLLTIINDILDFTKMDIDKLQLEHTRFDLHKLLRNCNELLNSLAFKKQLALTLQLGPQLPQFVSGDPDRLRQVLINLINNAIKFTRHGQVKVSASLVSTNGHNAIIRCRVSDTGIGIKPDHLASLFDEFTMVDQTHSRRYEGTGLGLAICKRLVTLMKGEITVTSEINHGSTFDFTIELQLAQESDDKQELSAQQIKQLPLNNVRVLLAEDNPANQMVIKSILEFAELQVDVVSNGFEAVEAVRTLPYDIVLMDISMPEMDGMEATQHIRQLSAPACNVPIVALTAHTLQGDKDRFLQASMNDYLSKPIDREATLACICRWTQTDPAPAALSQTAAPSTQNMDDYALVDESILLQLVADTSADIVPDLLLLYIEDSESRLALIQDAIAATDYKTLEFECHTIGSSAIAHGNVKLHHIARSAERACQQEDFAQAITAGQQLVNLAQPSFEKLSKRAKQGFMPSGATNA